MNSLFLKIVSWKLSQIHFFKKQAEMWHFNYNIESRSWKGSQKGLLNEIGVEQDVIVESQEQEAEKE